MIRNRVKQALAPIKNMAIGAGLGLGAGALYDFLMNSKDKEDDYNVFKRPLLFAALGTMPGLLQGGLQYVGSVGNKGLDNNSKKLDNSLKWYEPFTLDQSNLIKKSPTYKNHMRTLVQHYKLDTDYNDPKKATETSLDKKLAKHAAFNIYNIKPIVNNIYRY